MSKPRLSYFDAPVSRGEECRLALAIAGVLVFPSTPMWVNAIGVL